MILPLLVRMLLIIMEEVIIICTFIKEVLSLLLDKE